jgi:GrpB-like predicted nucleotidyltransferase (UPF0157 family)
VGAVTLGVEFPFVRLSPYTPDWARAFADERDRIASVIGSHVLDIQHVGSTSIPGLSAKPIIDIAIAVPTLEVAELLRPQMAEIGYDYAGDGGVPGQRIYGRGPRLRTHLVHAVISQGQAWSEYMSFRDTLRRDPALTQEYDTLKRSLAEKYPDDRPSYTAAKGKFIEKVLRGAA